MFMEIVYLRTEIFLDFDLLEIAPLYLSFSTPNSEFRDDEYSNYKIEDKDICRGFYFDIEVVPIKLFATLNVPKCETSFIYWMIEGTPLEFLCGYDLNSVIKMPETLLFRGYKGTFPIL